MTAPKNITYDVFVSHTAADSDVARDLAQSLAAAGLVAFLGGTVPPGEDLGEAIWQALAESRALIAIVSPNSPSHAMGLVEIGAATAWNKPIFVIINGPSSAKLPAALTAYPVYPLARFDEVIRSIRAGFEPLTEDERSVLTDTYQDLGLPADQLAQAPAKLRDLTAAFNKRTRKRLSGERLLSEILRLRKSSQLPRLGKPKSLQT